jgi:hypothetical protein
MTPQRSKPPFTYDIFDEDYAKDVFFGNTQLQDKVIGTIESGLKESRGKIYIIYGPVRSGKSDAYEAVTRKVESGRLADTQFLYYYDLLNDSSQFDPQKHNVILLNSNSDLGSLNSYIKAANALIAKGFKISVVLDLINEGVAVLPGMETVLIVQKKRIEKEKLDEITTAQDNIVICKTGYSINQVSAVLWELYETINKKYDNVAPVLRKYYFESKEHPELDEIFSALEANDRTRYDAAFKRVREVSRLKRSPEGPPPPPR